MSSATPEINLNELATCTFRCGNEETAPAPEVPVPEAKVGKHGGVYVLKTTKDGNRQRKVYFKELNELKAKKALERISQLEKLTGEELEAFKIAEEKRKVRNEKRREQRKRKRGSQSTSDADISKEEAEEGEVPESKKQKTE
jgi:hypothetical protein